ncbi:hypothetical protein [Leucobacter sp. GX24907]
MRLEIRPNTYDVANLDDTVATRIENKLLRAIEKIDQASDKAREIAERHRQREIEQQERELRAEKLRQRAARYDNWIKTLEQLRDDFVRHRELADTVAGLREAVAQRGPDHEYAELLGEYLSWSETHLVESDPFRRIWLPQGERPDMSFEEWQQWKRQHPRNW